MSERKIRAIWVNMGIVMDSDKRKLKEPGNSTSMGLHWKYLVKSALLEKSDDTTSEASTMRSMDTVKISQHVNKAFPTWVKDMIYPVA